MAIPLPQPDPPSTEVFRPVPQELSESYDDMRDSPEIIRDFPSLPLAACQKIEANFRTADAAALHYQTWHRWLTRSAAFFGTTAVVLAIAELGRKNLPANSPLNQLLGYIGENRLSQAELLCVLIAVIVGAWGMGWAYKERWLWRRHQAESYRLLKYRFLIHPSVWEKPEWIDQQIDQIAKPDAEKATNAEIREALRHATREPVPHGPFEVTERQLSRSVVVALVEYYLARRLSPQKEYLANRVSRNEKGDWIERVIFLLFAGSVIAVLLRFLPQLWMGGPRESWPLALAVLASVGWALSTRIPRTEKGGIVEWTASLLLVFAVLALLKLALPMVPDPEKEGAWSVRFTFAAALLPAIAAGVRLLRSSAEFSRNKARFEAAHRALGELEECLMHDGLSSLSASATQPETTSVIVDLASLEVAVEGGSLDGDRENEDAKTNAYTVVRDLWWCEHILRTEHMEWLRLMHETEWFG